MVQKCLHCLIANGIFESKLRDIELIKRKDNYYVKKDSMSNKH